MTEKASQSVIQHSRVVNIARCPEHGLHGERTECFICGGPVEQVSMVKYERLREAEAHLWALVVWYGEVAPLSPYVQRDFAAAADYVNRYLSDEDMTTRHREVVGDA